MSNRIAASCGLLVRRLTHKRLGLVLTADLMTMAAAGLFAFLLRFELAVPEHVVPILALSLPIWLILKTGLFALFQVHCRSLRYVSLADAIQLFGVNTVGAALSFVALAGLLPWMSRSVCIIDWLLCSLFTLGWRMAARWVAEATLPAPGARPTQRTLIYGAGRAGAALLRELQQNAATTYQVCGLIDDAPQKCGLSIYGQRVLGSGRDLPRIVHRHNIDVVLIALSSASGVAMTQVMQHCHNAGIAFKTIPCFADRMNDNGLARQIRDVNVEDLLGRSPVRLEERRIASQLRGKVVLVTGAAGSIGSELCRQIARFEPARIIGYDLAETGLFHIEHEMARSFPQVPFTAEVGSIQSRERLADVFSHHRPTVVYHAAAYKHVPLMEAHPFEAVANNVFGTLNVVRLADDFGATDFVMISSDKAVRPTNVMGATKRVAELLVRAFGDPRSKHVSVRFGNVLGSNGSVVPTFKQQISAGGPVTVTHPEMRRYFMTIPEACQLVLQASAMGAGGEIFVLDMGEPVRIVDLARNLILLSGLRPNEDIRIEYSGIRPGEKLYEELSTQDEDVRGTSHDKIKIFTGPSPEQDVLRARMQKLERAKSERDLADLIQALRELVPEYRPSADVLDRSRRSRVIPLAATGTYDRRA